MGDELSGIEPGCLNPKPFEYDIWNFLQKSTYNSVCVCVCARVCVCVHACDGRIKRLTEVVEMLVSWYFTSNEKSFKQKNRVVRTATKRQKQDSGL